jgi:AcrR family transcriptional regulator
MDAPVTKRYTSHLRQTQVELTQRTIMEAMAAVLIEFGPEGDAVKEVARRANVSERTIYRHFPSKEALWDAFLLWVSARVGLDEYPATADEMLATIEPLFAKFDDNEELLRACLDIRAWSDVWLSGRSGWKDGISRMLDNSFPGLSEESRDKFGGVVHVLFNGINWKTLKDQWGFSGDQAAVAAKWALAAVFKEVELAALNEKSDKQLRRKGKPPEERRKVEGVEVKGRHYSQQKSSQPEKGTPNKPKS